MLVSCSKHFFIRPSSTWIIFQLNKRNNSTTKSPKLTTSYFHHISSLPLVYKTISQSFDETAAKYPHHECYVFKSIYLHIFFIYLFFIGIIGEHKRYTYQSFKDEVDNLAASLLELGFEKNDRFAVWLPNTSENVAMTFAASKLGLIKVNNDLFFSSDYSSLTILYFLRLTSIQLMLDVNLNIV